MASATTTVKMDEQGRVIIPKAARQKLGIDGTERTVEVEVRVDE